MHQVLTRKASGRSDLWTLTNVENITKTASPYNFFSGCTNDTPIASFRATSNNGMSPRTNSNKEYLTSDPTDEFFICGGELAIDFSNTSSFNTVGVKWLFEGGEPSTSTLSDPKIKYKKGGEFKVQLIAYNQDRSDTTTQTVKIFDYGDRFYGNQNAKENFESYNHIDEYAWSSSSSGEKGWEITNKGFLGGKNLYLSNNTSLNKRAAFRTPMYSLKSIVDAQLVFKVAKARVENNRSVLSINSVSNCYQPTKSLAIFTDGALSVDTLTGYGVFIPQSEHWKTIKIDLPKELLASEEASFVFTFFGFLQTDIYIDDIEIQSRTLTSVSDLAIKPQLHVYPNPANEELKIDYQSASHREVHFRLIGIDGRTYSLSGSTRLQGSMQQYTFPIAQLANGVYFVQATQEGHLTTSKVVILR